MPPEHPLRVELAEEVHARPPDARQFALSRLLFRAVQVIRWTATRNGNNSTDSCGGLAVAPPLRAANYFNTLVGR